MKTASREDKNAAHERATDAKSLKDARRELAAVYTAGYVVECKLKAEPEGDRQDRRFSTTS
jgi:hypothetical protein